MPYFDENGKKRRGHGLVRDMSASHAGNHGILENLTDENYKETLHDGKHYDINNYRRYMK